MPSFKPVRTKIRMSDRIVQQIEEKLLRHQLEPLSMLPSENQMVEEFGVSRSTVREALRMLEASGVIKIKQGSGGGAMVCQVTDGYVSEFLVKAIRFGGISGDQLCQFRLALEPYIAEMVAKKKDIDPELISLMEKNIAEARALHDKGRISGYLDMDFHVLLATATGNPLFIITLKTLKISFDIITSRLKIRAQIETNEYHQKILKAIKERDSVAAKEQMYQDLLNVYKGLKDENITI